MKINVNRKLLPIKAHFFFFFAALGPILPQLNVFGRQLGVSPAAMGMVTAVLPLLWAMAKPLFGYIVDFWPARRKLVFMMLITLMSGSYCGLWFIPTPSQNTTVFDETIYQMNDTIYLKTYNNDTTLQKFTCHWNCTSGSFEFYLSNVTYVSTLYIEGAVKNSSCHSLKMDLDKVIDDDVVCSSRNECFLMCVDVDLNSNLEHGSTKLVDATLIRSGINNTKFGDESLISGNKTEKAIKEWNVTSKLVEKITVIERDGFYMTVSFWAFVILMCVGTVAFNVANCIGDAVCFDVLGEYGSKYGAQRAWGTVGYGLTALAGGYLVDTISVGYYKNFTPAFVIVIVATVIDLYSCRALNCWTLIVSCSGDLPLYGCRALNLPSLSSPDDSGKALRDVLKIPRVVVFIIFAVVAGTFDSFIIYYMFWFLEELAEQTDQIANIKLIEGVVVAAQSFIGELLFFFFSGKIITRFGYGMTLTFSLFSYGVRMALISFIQHPWHLVFIEAIMQGPTYALCYSTIVGYAAHVAPEGYSATVQGIIAGMDDGLGFAIGSLLGGQLYSYFGGRGSFRLFAMIAGVGAVLHALLFKLVTRAESKEAKPKVVHEEIESMLPNETQAVIYRETTQPLQKEDR